MFLQLLWHYNKRIKLCRREQAQLFIQFIIRAARSVQAKTIIKVIVFVFIIYNTYLTRTTQTTEQNTHTQMCMQTYILNTVFNWIKVDLLHLISVLLWISASGKLPTHLST